jgi:hypothetical protein
MRRIAVPAVVLVLLALAALSPFALATPAA